MSASPLRASHRLHRDRSPPRSCTCCLHHCSRVRQATSAGARGCKSRRACSASAAAAACTTSTASHTGCTSGTCARSMRARHAACQKRKARAMPPQVITPASGRELRLGPPPRGPGGPDRPAPRCNHRGCGFGPAGPQSGPTLRALEGSVRATARACVGAQDGPVGNSARRTLTCHPCAPCLHAWPGVPGRLSPLAAWWWGAKLGGGGRNPWTKLPADDTQTAAHREP